LKKECRPKVPEDIPLVAGKVLGFLHSSGSRNSRYVPLVYEYSEPHGAIRGVVPADSSPLYIGCGRPGQYVYGGTHGNVVSFEMAVDIRDRLVRLLEQRDWYDNPDPKLSYRPVTPDILAVHIWDLHIGKLGDCGRVNYQLPAFDEE
jgi:hypothetical protein